ncbi:RNA-guided endonuclease InsQ/TnpB family protein [Lactobacillus gigeriorum]|uniref:Transposase n=2 Tax=Lactobacillus gigeriorum DSM 23908 = CRBIP 24.85 TaxID=1423751 RepID=I7LFX3_9LACO|nr:RNA-guided endonuclease TnpB family protein [Lactobacillus gigeriorum]CCI87063.1 Transposase [Lactobacillus gigeriorum DSM 23908 = CRBIP 24.85]
MPEYYIKTRSYELFPNKQMKAVLDRNCDYRRFCWNEALALWNDEYDIRQVMLDKKIKAELRKPKSQRKFTAEQEKMLASYPAPNWQEIRNKLVAEKEDWQFGYSAHLLQLAVQDLGKAWQNFFNKAQKDWGKPKFKSKRSPRQGFKSDQARIVNGKLVLEKPQGLKANWQPIKLSEKPFDYPTGIMSIYRENTRYFVAIPYKIPKDRLEDKKKTGKATGVDINVGHFNYQDGQLLIIPKALTKTYNKIKHYQKQLAKKRTVNGRIKGTQSKKYLKARIKLQTSYQRAENIQTDLMHKFTTKLVNDYDQIAIEDLAVKGMLMSHIASKGMHRSMFGQFRQLLTYKCQWYDKELIVANKLYPSTQRCAVCGLVKKGDERITLQGNKKHGTKHNEFVCYNPSCPNYNKKVDRDENAMANLTLLVNHPELNQAL